MKTPLKILLHILLVTLASLSLCQNTSAVTLMERIQDLEPFIGAFPPKIKNEKEAARVRKHYVDAKSGLDASIKAHPEDQDLLFMRGHLQSMGHNFDFPGAFRGSTEDFTALLKMNPAHVHAQLELASLWVNSDKRLAPDAEKLFRDAQCTYGNEPLEPAQSGIVFALYYQGKMQEALRQSEYLMLTWPENEQYKDFNGMIKDVLARAGSEADIRKLPTELAMATCRK